MSFFATPGKHAEIDMIDTIPVVRGDGGVGGLAESLSKAFQFTTERAAVVRGHGVFAISHQNFDEALAALTEVEQRCKTSYFALLNERHQI
jgi:ribulose-5-phosphate 4-epimerase/fuculose-1-phosphate aldolase